MGLGMAIEVSDAEINAAFGTTLTATERALVRRIISLEARMRQINGDIIDLRDMSGAVGLAQIAADMTEPA